MMTNAKCADGCTMGVAEKRIADLEAALREARAMLRVVSLDKDADELRASWDRGIAKIDAALGN